MNPINAIVAGLTHPANLNGKTIFIDIFGVKGNANPLYHNNGNGLSPVSVYKPR